MAGVHMADMGARTTTGAGATWGAAFEALRARFRGALLRPGEEGYDEGRRVWNGAIDRHPALIARCAGADDVVEAVRFGRDHEVPLSVRGGGHSIAGHGVVDGGLMIDLSLMKAASVDPASRTARAAGGLLWADLDRATQRHALAVTGGIISHTGIGGLTLGGGLGHLMRTFGLTVDSLTGAEVVTADGETIRADAERDPELLWGLKGGGGNFGIVTSFEYALHPVGPMVLGGPMFWSIDDAPAVLRFLDGFAAEAPDELGITLVARLAPPAIFLAPEHHGRPVLGLVLVWAGDMATGREAIAPLRTVRRPIADSVQPVPYLALQSMLDGGAAHGIHYYWKSHRLPNLSQPVIDAILGSVETITSPLSQIGGWAIGGTASRVDPGATAVGDREVGFELNVTAGWQPVDPDPERHRAWVRTGWEALVPFRTGVYANFLSDEDAAGVESAYGERLARLTALKDRLDPTNVLRLNANVVPSGRTATG